MAARKVGQRRIYTIEQKGLADLRAYLDSLWGTALDAFAAETRKKQGPK